MVAGPAVSGSTRSVATPRVVRTVVVSAWAGVREAFGDRLTPAAATATYYGGIAVVPWLLLAAWSSTWFGGVDEAQERLLRLRVLVPEGMGARPAYDALVDAGVHLGLLGALVVLLPASLWGEGLRRSALVLQPQPDKLTGWRARAALAPALVALPPVTWAVLEVADLAVPLTTEGGGGGPGDLTLRVVLGFTAVWLGLGVLLAWMLRQVAPGRPRWWVAFLGGLGTGSFLAGFLHGFLLFLAIPIDVGAPFGGLGVVGGVVAVGLWLFVFHLVVLVGWAATRSIEDGLVAADHGEAAR
jgi:membrane protein